MSLMPNCLFQAQLVLAKCHKAEGDWKTSTASCNMSLLPNCLFQAQLVLVKCHYSQGDWKAGIASCYMSPMPSCLFQAQLVLAKCHKAQGDYKAGIASCNDAITSYSKENHTIKHRKGNAFYEKENLLRLFRHSICLVNDYADT